MIITVNLLRIKLLILIGKSVHLIFKLSQYQIEIRILN